ncbi:MAG: hypothetical protein JWN78_2622 [Bacteroidota bacterium]|nr:hypothetical protein [Bacteroidota bacterium]
MWQKYEKKDSGVESYKIGKDFIEVKFKTKFKPYMYNYKVTGKTHVEKMKKLARANKGLSTYISQNVKDKYDDDY